MADPKSLDFFITQYKEFAAQRNDGQLQIIFAKAERIEFSPNEIFFRAGQPVKDIFLLESGVINELQPVSDARSGKRIVSRERTPGRFLGIYDLVYRRPHSTTASVLEGGVAYKLPVQEAFRLLYHYPTLRQGLIPFHVLNRLRTIPLFCAMSPTILGFLAETHQYLVADAKSSLYKVNDPAESVYIVDVGQVELRYEDGRKRWLGNSQPFGLSDTQATPSEDYLLDHSAEAGCFTKFFKWNRQEFRRITGIFPERLARLLHEQTRTTVEQLSIFSAYSEEERDRLAGYMSHYHYPQPNLLLQQGEFSDNLWVLMAHYQGMMYSYVAGELQKSGVVGQVYFNENALRSREACKATVQAETDSQWLCLHANDFRQFLAKEANQELGKKLDVPDHSTAAIGKEEKGFDFPLLPGESVQLFERRHWIVFLQKILAPLIFFAIIVVGWGSFMLVANAAWWVDVPVLLLLLSAGLWMLWGWLDYRNDYFLVTNMRVAQVEKVIFFSESRITALLEQIRDVSFEQKTFWQTYWQYGTIFVQTASKSKIAFDFLRNPAAATKTINQLNRTRAEHYDAGSKREIYKALEQRLGLTIDTPERVWNAPASKAKPTYHSWWSFFFNREARESYLTERKADRVVWRKHWVVLLGMTGVPALLTFASTLATIGLIIYFILGAPTAFGVAAIPISLFSAFCWLWLRWSVQDWYNDTYEVTDNEIIDTEMRPLFFPFYFDKNVRRAGLNDINDITYTIPTPVNYLLNMGNVYAETAAQVGKFTFDRVRNPAAVADEIRRRIEQYLDAKHVAENRRQAQGFPIWFEMYERLGKERDEDSFFQEANLEKGD